MSFMIKDVNILDKYNDIWDKIKEKLDIKFSLFRRVQVWSKKKYRRLDS